LFLGCDGFFETLNNAEVSTFVVKDLNKQIQNNEDICPSSTMARLCDHSVASGSTDNMTGILVMFLNGKDYHQKGMLFEPGPIDQLQENADLVQSYLMFASESGFENEASSFLTDRGINDGS
jgi:serine/threonine protein phosphatase PrpC